MDRLNSHDPRAIANKILDIREAQGEPLTVMQLIKLVYMSDGWTMAALDRPLSSEPPQAWQYGPVYPKVYRAFRRFGANPVTDKATLAGTDIAISETFSEDEDRLINAVVKAYGKLSAYQLSNLTHQPNTPWSKAYASGAYSQISAAEMKRHFDELRAKPVAG